MTRQTTQPPTVDVLSHLGTEAEHSVVARNGQILDLCDRTIERQHADHLQTDRPDVYGFAVPATSLLSLQERRPHEDTISPECRACMRRVDVVGIRSVEDRAALDGKVGRVAAGWIVQTIADGAQSDHVS